MADLYLDLNDVAEALIAQRSPDFKLHKDRFIKYYFVVFANPNFVAPIVLYCTNNKELANHAADALKSNVLNQQLVDIILPPYVIDEKSIQLRKFPVRKIPNMELYNWLNVSTIKFFEDDALGSSITAHIGFAQLINAPFPGEYSEGHYSLCIDTINMFGLDIERRSNGTLYPRDLTNRLVDNKMTQISMDYGIQVKEHIIKIEQFYTIEQYLLSSYGLKIPFNNLVEFKGNELHMAIDVCNNQIIGKTVAIGDVDIDKKYPYVVTGILTHFDTNYAYAGAIIEHSIRSGKPFFNIHHCVLTDDPRWRDENAMEAVLNLIICHNRINIDADIMAIAKKDKPAFNKLIIDIILTKGIMVGFVIQVKFYLLI
jgi:hypothetical protein